MAILRPWLDEYHDDARKKAEERLKVLQKTYHPAKRTGRAPQIFYGIGKPREEPSLHSVVTNRITSVKKKVKSTNLYDLSRGIPNPDHSRRELKMETSVTAKVWLDNNPRKRKKK